MKQKTTHDIIVVGGGHAGVEAANIAAKMNRSVLMITMDKKAIGRMSCNPAIGGLAKGQMVREIDMLGGLMGRLADKSGLQFKILNKSKGRAVWSPRAQLDKRQYEYFVTSAVLLLLFQRDHKLNKNSAILMLMTYLGYLIYKEFNK